MQANVWNNWSPRRPRVLDIEKYVNALEGPNPLISHQLPRLQSPSDLLLGSDRLCHTPPVTIPGMKLKFFPPSKDEGEVVASWGEAQLIKYLDGKTELRGGSDHDWAEAREWMSLFWHEAVVREGSGRWL